jgi:hypothetical protein
MTAIAYIVRCWVLVSDGAGNVRFNVNYCTSDGMLTSGLITVIPIDTELNMMASLRAAVATNVNTQLGTAITGADVRLF